MYCRQCDVLMKHVMRFSDGVASELYRCPICYYESKPHYLHLLDDKIIQENKGTNKHKKKKRKRR